MNNIKRWIKSEIDVEFFAAAHAITMVFIYGFELFLYGKKEVPFIIIFEMFMLGYIISWLQKLLFLKEKIYSAVEYKVRAITWNLGPIILTFLTGRLFHWYKGYSLWFEIVFLSIMFIYYLAIWAILQILYKDESQSLNDMLYQYKVNRKNTIVDREDEEDGNN